MNAVRQFVDFNSVRAEHADIHARLENWGRWSENPGRRAVAPMFRMYRSSHAWSRELIPGSNPVDSADATRIQRAVVALPFKHRLALSWAYIRRNNPRKAATSLGLTMQGLASMIEDGRQMLINLRA